MEGKQYKNSPYIIYPDGRCYSNLSHKFLTPQMSVKYPSYNLTIEGTKKKIKVHRMVAETFLPKVEGKEQINHKDGNTHNFNVENLEWVNASENAKHASAMKLRPKSDQTLFKKEEDLPGEKWYPVKDYPNYQISSCGRLMTISTGRLKQFPISSGGYYYTNLWNQGKGKTLQVHQLVYTNVTGDQNLEGYVINHKDGNKLNNNIDNLEKISYKENNLHATYDIKTNKCTKPVYQVDIESGEVIREFESVTMATKITSINNIARAARGGKTAGGYKWIYK